MANIPLRMKFVIIGDGAVGKTSLLYTYANKDFPDGYVPTVMDNYKVELPFKNNRIILEIWDTAGQENFGALRELSYPNTDVFLICYSCVNQASLNNIETVWLKEAKKHNTHFVLVGTKQDLVTFTAEKDGEWEVVKETEAIQMMKKTGADACFQCSALHNQGVQDVFKNSIKIVYDASLKEGSCCTVV